MEGVVGYSPYIRVWDIIFIHLSPYISPYVSLIYPFSVCTYIHRRYIDIYIYKQDIGYIYPGYIHLKVAKMGYLCVYISSKCILDVFY